MATVYLADDYGHPIPEALGGVMVVRAFTFTNPILVVNDQIKLARIPGSFPSLIFLGFDIEVPDLDDSTGIVLRVGDSLAVDHFMTTTLCGTVGQSPGRLCSFDAPSPAAGGAVIGSLPTKYTADDDLILTVQAGPTTGTAGGLIRGYILYTQESCLVPEVS